MTAPLAHERLRDARSSDDWITPRAILGALGRFDLDPCASDNQPWPTADRMHAARDGDGLALPWAGRVFLNPPYRNVVAWLQRLAEHGDGIALVFARVETDWWWRWVWTRADAVLFVRGRIRFALPSGGRGPGRGVGPSALVAYGRDNADCLDTCGVAGALVNEWHGKGLTRS